MSRLNAGKAVALIALATTLCALAVPAAASDKAAKAKVTITGRSAETNAATGLVRSSHVSCAKNRKVRLYTYRARLHKPPKLKLLGSGLASGPWDVDHNEYEWQIPYKGTNTYIAKVGAIKGCAKAKSKPTGLL